VRGRVVSGWWRLRALGLALIAIGSAAGGCAADGAGRSPDPIGRAAPADHARAATAAPLSIDELYRSPVAALPRLSPDGRWLAVLARRDGNLDLAVRPVADGAPAGRLRFLTGDDDPTVDDFTWSADSRSIFFVQDDPAGGTHLYQVSLDERRPGRSGVRDLTPFGPVEVRLLCQPIRAPEVVAVAMNRRDPARPDAYRIDLATGALTMAARNPGWAASYLADDRGKVLVATSVDRRGRSSVHHRQAEGSPWRTVMSVPPGEEMVLIGFADRPDRIYVRTDHGGDLERLAALDLGTGALETVAEDPDGRVDLDDVLWDALGRPIASRFVDDDVRWVSRDPAFRALLARAPRANLEVLSRSADGALWTLASSGPTRPAVFYLAEPARGRLVELARSRPVLDGRPLADTRPIRVRARDGLVLGGYLTLPASARPASGPPYPTVLMVHGGPWARDVRDFDPDRQFLASRGYAVLSVNFRGSSGFGRGLAEGANGGFAAAMQDDLVDAVDWAIARGIAARGRVAVVGGSYGGYAVLMALAGTPDRFACGVDLAGPVDLARVIESFPPSWEPRLRKLWYRYVGHPAVPAERAAMTRLSPTTRVDGIRAPLLLFQGGRDPRMTRELSDDLALRLYRRGVPVTYLFAPDEGHSLSDRGTILALFRATEIFLAGCLGGRATPTATPEIEAALEQLTVDLRTLDAATRSGR
jgi:dipeptidyl aminopeptidase/acylaminoacyl peptidase